MGDYLNSVDLLLHLKCNYEQMSVVEKKITDYFLVSLEQVPDKTVTEVSDICEVSEASIVRFVKKLGFNGFYQMKIELAKSSSQSLEPGRHESDPESISGVVEKSLSIALENIQNSYESIPSSDLEKTVELLASCRMVYFFAAGNSIPLCHSFIYRLGRLGIKGAVSNVPEMSLIQAQNMEQGDIAFAITHSGDSILVNEALQTVKSKNLPVIGLTNFKKSPVMKWIDLPIVTAVQHDLFNGAENFTRLTEAAILDLLFYLLFFRKKDFYEGYVSQTESDQSVYSI